MDASISVDGVSILGGSGMRGAADTPDAKKFSVRLKEIYKEKINYYREAVYLLTGCERKRDRERERGLRGRSR